jgi:nucleoside-diphosphate-sugar epimerase
MLEIRQTFMVGFPVGALQKYVQSAVVGDFQYQPVGEDHPAVPTFASEILVQSFARRFGLRYAIVRPSAVDGLFDVNERVAQGFVEHALDAGRTSARNSL